MDQCLKSGYVLFFGRSSLIGKAYNSKGSVYPFICSRSISAKLGQKNYKFSLHGGHSMNGILDSQFREYYEAGSTMLQVAGEQDLTRPGIKETPKRMVNALLEMTWGARVDEAEFLQSLKTTFDEECDQMIKVRNINFVSLCEHHVLPFLGTATVAYIPKDNQILGLSKLARLVGYYGARLQIQERMTRQIASAVVQLINPLGVGVCLQARHLCMEVRGVRAVGATTITSDLRGAIRNLGPAREEFFLLINA